MRDTEQTADSMASLQHLRDNIVAVLNDFQNICMQNHTISVEDTILLMGILLYFS